MKKNILFSFINRGASLTVGAMTVLIFSLFPRSSDLGYYYTFNSLLMIQIFFEIGVSSVLVLHVARSSSLSNKKRNLRIRTLYPFIVCLFFILSLMFALTSLLVGSWFFVSEPFILPIWSLAVIFFSINFFLNAGYIILEGENLIYRVAIIRSFQVLVGFGLLLFFYFFSNKLYFVIGMYLGALLVNVFAIIIDKNLRTYYILGLTCNVRIMKIWLLKIRNLQIKVAISWASGYLIFQLITPVIFKKFGAEPARNKNVNSP